MQNCIKMNTWMKREKEKAGTLAKDIFNHEEQKV